MELIRNIANLDLLPVLFIRHVAMKEDDPSAMEAKGIHPSL